MTGTTQKEEINKKKLSHFSESILSKKHLKKACFISSDVSEIINSRGPFVEDDKGNIFFDLRLNSQKPFWGHALPIVLKYDFHNEVEPQLDSITFHNLNQTLNPKKSYIVKDIFFSDGQLIPKELEEFEDLYLYFSKDIIINYSKREFLNTEEPHELLLDFINTILIKGKRVDSISKEIMRFCHGFKELRAQGLNIIIKDTRLTPTDFAKFCIYIDEPNYIDGQLYLSLPTSFTRDSLDEFFERLSHVLRGLECF